MLLVIVAPVIFMWTNIPPLVNVTAEGIIHYLAPMVLAIVGGILVYAPRQYYPIAAQVLGIFQSFKILPTVLAALIKPYGQVFKVTPKGAAANKSDYERNVFWITAALLALTAVGLLINATPEWRIVTQAALIPIVAICSGINITVLLLVCMMSLQAPIRRVEERFEVDELVWIFTANGSVFSGRTKDMSLSGIGIEIESNRALAATEGEQVRMFLAEVGFVKGKIVRNSASFMGVNLDLPPSLERDLMIRKLFTGAVANAPVEVSVAAATGSLLKSIWSAPTSSPPNELEEVRPVEQLPAESLVVLPSNSVTDLKQIVASRKAMAA